MTPSSELDLQGPMNVFHNNYYFIFKPIILVEVAGGLELIPQGTNVECTLVGCLSIIGHTHSRVYKH